MCLVSAVVKRQNPKLQRLFQVQDYCCSKCGFCPHIQSDWERERWLMNLNKSALSRQIFKPVKCHHSSQLICLHAFTSICPIRPCRWQFKGIFHMHIQTNTDSKTLGGPWNVNTGLLRTKGRKEKRKKGKRRGGKRWEKPIFLKNSSRSKAFYSQRPRMPGYNYLTIAECWKDSLQTGHRSHLFKERGEQLGLQNPHTASAKMEGSTCNRRPSPCRPGGLLGPQCPPSAPRHVFLWIAQKSASAVMRHKLFDNNMTQLIRTRPPNVCAWGPANFAMCFRGWSNRRGSHWLFGKGEEWGERQRKNLYVHKRCTPMALYN